jgi:uncharacterized coiled-coil DUF342 family protein
MTKPALTLRHLCLTGPDKRLANVSFGHGLNVIYGASETGKSFIVEALDFMLGASTELRDIPERVGYDRIFLGIEDGDGESFTLERSASGGQFRWYEGLHLEAPEGVEPKSLAAKHNPTRPDNVSTFLLDKIGLAGKRVRRNASGDTNNLSFRNLAHLCLIAEGDIQKRGSTIETGQFITRTLELAVFKLLLTGVDDSSIEPIEKTPTESLSRSAKIEVIDELIQEHKAQLSERVGEEDDPAELNNQLAKVEDVLARERAALRETEQTYQQGIQRRSQLRRDVAAVETRRTEIDELLARFHLLDEHYGSDLARLEGVREAGSLLGALSPQICPLCGASPESQKHEADCDGNIEVVVSAADAESRKIELLRSELHETVDQLLGEAQRFDRLTPGLSEELRRVEAQLEEINPTVSEQRAAYSEIFEKRSEVQQALNLLATIADLETRKSTIEATPRGKGTILH